MICRHCDTDVERDELAGHLVGVHGLRLCVLCSRRGRVTQVESGHCCAVCRVRILDDLAAIVALAADAAAWIPPGRTGSSGGRTVPGSRPPLNLDAIDPELTLVRLLVGDPSSDETVLALLESWERLIREERGFAPYGPATALKLDDGPRVPSDSSGPPTVSARPGTDHSYAVAGAYRPNRATLTAVVRFLATQVDYATTEPTFGLEQFAHEIALCRTVLARWGHDQTVAPAGVGIDCPTLLDDGTECGRRLRVSTLVDHVHCPRCRAERTGETLARIALHAGGAGVWVDSAAAAAWLGCSERTLRRWAAQGRVERAGGRYWVRPAEAAGA